MEALEDRAVPSALVSTDKPDYAPGETVNILATGFKAGESVAFQVYDLTDSETLSSWRVRDGGAYDLDHTVNGEIQTTWIVSASAANDALRLNATGMSSGLFAQTFFTDAAPQFTFDFVAAEPSTYDHATGGGMYDGRIIGTNVVESLEGNDFACDDIVTFFVAITVDSGVVGSLTTDIGVVFNAFSTGQEGIAYTDIVGVQINYPDSGNVDDNGSVATLTNEIVTGPLFTQGSEIQGTIQVTDLEAGEVVILRVDVRIGCTADADNATGNVQASLDVQGGQQTIPLMGVENVVVVEADLSLTKIVSNAAPNVGDNVTFTVTVTNGGPDQATNVTVSDLLPAGLSFVSSTPSQGTYDSTTGLWTVGTLNSGGSATLEITATVLTADVKINSAEVEASDQHDPDSTPGNLVGTTPVEDDEASVTVTPQVADLSLSKIVDNAAPNVGDNVTFTVTVNNGGTDQATGVTVSDLLPAGLSFVSSTPSQGTYDSNTGLWTVGTLNSGGSATLEITATVLTSDVKINCAEVEASDQNDPDSTPGNLAGTTHVEDDEDCVTVTPQVADLSLSKIVDNDTPNVGDTVTFTITVSNTGPNAATNVTVSDDLPANVSFVSSTPSQGTYDSNTGLWTVGTLNNGGNATLTITAEVLTPGDLANCAQVQHSDQFDPDSTPGNLVGTIPVEDDEACVSASGQQADLSLTKIVSNSSPMVGDNVTFTVTVNNAGPSTATNVTVSDLLPAGLSFVSSTPSQGTYDSNTGLWTVGALNNGASATLTITAQVLTASTLTNLAQVQSSDQPDPDSTPGNLVGTTPVEDDEARVDVSGQQADLSLTKGVSSSTANVGDNLTFTITVTNSGPSTATNVTVSDILPAAVSFVSSNPSQGSYDSGTGLWTVGTLSNGASATLTITAQVLSAGTLTNLAQVQSSDQPDPDSTPGNLVGTTPVEDDEDSIDVFVNSVPIAVNDPFDCKDLAGLIDSTKAFSFSTALLLDNDSDPDGDPISVTQVSGTTSLGGTVALNGATITYTPPTSFAAHAVDSFTYTISDGNGGTATATVFFTLNHPPIAKADAFSTVQGTTLTGKNVLTNDSDLDNDPLVVTNAGTFTSTSGGTVVLNANGTFTYKPPSSTFTGTDSFSYTIVDDCGAASTATVTIKVTALSKRSFLSR